MPLSKPSVFHIHIYFIVYASSNIARVVALLVDGAVAVAGDNDAVVCVGSWVQTLPIVIVYLANCSSSNTLF